MEKQNRKRRNLGFLGGCPVFCLKIPDFESGFFFSKMTCKYFNSDPIFQKIGFLTLDRVKAKTTRTKGARCIISTPMTLILVKIDKIPRKQCQFDPMSDTSKKRAYKDCIWKRHSSRITRTIDYFNQLTETEMGGLGFLLRL